MHRAPVHRDAPIFGHYDSYWYGKPNVSRFTGNYIHRYCWTGLIETHTFFWSDWWKHSNITQQHHALVQPLTVVVVDTPSTGVAGYARCSWSQVCLLSCYSWHPSGILLCLDTYRDTYCIMTPVSRYESYREAPILLHPYHCCKSKRIWVSYIVSKFKIPILYSIHISHFYIKCAIKQFKT